VHPHSVHISPYDPARHVWVIDDGAQMVWKFTNDGRRIVQQWGEWRVPGNDASHFGRPTKRRVFVADRGNRRIQIFDEHGRFIEA
jgi:hypothetical protein